MTAEMEITGPTPPEEDPVLTPRQHARFSAAYIAVDIAKTIAPAVDVSVEQRVQDVLTAAERVHEWLVQADPVPAPTITVTGGATA